MKENLNVGENETRQTDMSIEIVARTVEVEDKTELENYYMDSKVFAGKAAGVCYMPDNYLEKAIQDREKALKRAKGTAASGHHSVFDHGHISMIVKAPKMICMILNSLGVYATSEKSARYTKMKPETELELQLYDKWKSKLQKVILETYPNIDDIELSKRFCKEIGMNYSPSTIINGSFSHIKEDDYMEETLQKIKQSETLPSYKLAQENARYMISVFTPTVMMYTVSIRQACLIQDYFEKLHINLTEGNLEETDFHKKLLSAVDDFLYELKKVTVDILDKPIEDNKNQNIRFLESQVSGKFSLKNGDLTFEPYTKAELLLRDNNMKDEKEIFGDSYKLKYKGTFAMLAQAQRHRTIRYKMRFTDGSKYGYYVPPIIKGTTLGVEWLKDIQSVAYCIPQGAYVEIIEQGLFEDYVLKCKERLCGRAQLEIMKNTKAGLESFIPHKEDLSYDNKFLLESVTDSNKDEALARCAFSDFRCAEGCIWGGKEALTRKI